MILQAGTAFWCSWPHSFDGGGAEMEVTDENKAQHREGSGEGSVENPRLLTVAPLLLTGNQWNTTRCFEFEVLIKIRLVLRGFPWSFYSTWSQMHLWGWYREAFNTSTSNFSDLVCVKILLIHMNSLKTCKTSKTWWSYTYIRKMQDGAGICPPSTQNSSWKWGLLAYAL